MNGWFTELLPDDLFYNLPDPGEVTVPPDQISLI